VKSVTRFFVSLSRGQNLGTAAWTLLAAAAHAATNLSITGGAIIARRGQATACLLELDGGAAGRVGPEGAKGLADALVRAGLCNLTGLDLEGGTLGAAGTMVLAAVLPKLSELISLNFR
jgi:hypothetical protein